MNFLILYTFDEGPYEEHMLMLKMSIISVIREFPDKDHVKIIIYTTKKEQLIKSMSYFAKYVEVRQYEPIDFGHPVLNFESDMVHFNSIGHSRIFIIPSLVKEFNVPVIYMDNDTGMRMNSAEEIYKLLDGINTPVGYCLEYWTDFNCLYGNCGKYEELKSTEEKVSDIRGEISPINNGVMIFPNTEESHRFMQEIIDVYIKLVSHFQSHFHDMFAFSIVWHKYCKSIPLEETTLEYCITNIDKRYTYGKGSIDFLKNGDIPLIIHYYINKYDNIKAIAEIATKLIDNFKNSGRTCFDYEVLNHSLIPYMVSSYK